MATQTVVQRSGTQSSSFLLLLLLLFAGSGCSALIYEIVWFQLLQLAIGSTAVSLGFLLATYMGGLCLGSLALPRLKIAQRHPLRVYAALEAGIGICGILVLYIIPVVSRVYLAGAESGLPGMLLRGFAAGVCLLAPTALMGASLPAIVRWIESTPRGISWWGFLYGGNTLGAVVGCLAAAFYLLRVYDMATGTYVAAAINLLVAAVSYWVASRAPVAVTDEPREQESSRPDRPWTIYATIGVSGACALGAEVIWTRLLSMMLLGTVYVFSIILAVFLIGLAAGSAIASVLLKKRGAEWANAALGWCQILLTAGIAYTAYMITNVLPYWSSEPLLNGNNWDVFQAGFVRCLFGILPPTVLWGASFPLACAAAAGPDKDSGRLVGGIYSANTLGAIVGALAVSLVLIPAIGTQNSQRLLVLLSGASALLVLIPHARKHRSKETYIWLCASLAAASLLAWRVDAIPGKVIAYGRRMGVATGRVLYTKEGRNSSVAISQWSDGAFEVDVNGHVEATTEIYDMKLQRMVGHLPALLHPNPKQVLGIGFGAGVSAGTFTTYPGIERITVCEIEPVVPPTSTRYFSKQDYNVLYHPRTRMIYDDARHYLLTTKDMFDIIASDPLDVFVKGTAGLYSKEYFEAVKRHLNPGGMFTLYVPLYETDVQTIKSELATFLEVFPHGTFWANTVNGQGYDMVFLGQAEPLKINLDEVQARYERPDYAVVGQSLREVGVPSPIDLFGTFAGQRSDLAPWLIGADINRDGNLKLQYLAGWGINSKMEDYLYRQIMSYRHFPGNIFIGSPERMQALAYSLETER